METKNERFVQLLTHYEIKAPRLAELLGISVGLIDLIKVGKRGVTTKLIATVTEKFPEVSAEWLEFGRGEMVIQPTKGEAYKNAEKAGYNITQIVQEDAAEKIKPPVKTFSLAFSFITTVSFTF